MSLIANTFELLTNDLNYILNIWILGINQDQHATFKFLLINRLSQLKISDSLHFTVSEDNLTVYLSDKKIECPRKLMIHSFNDAKYSVSIVLQLLNALCKHENVRELYLLIYQSNYQRPTLIKELYQQLGLFVNLRSLELDLENYKGVAQDLLRMLKCFKLLVQLTFRFDKYDQEETDGETIPTIVQYAIDGMSELRSLTIRKLLPIKLGGFQRSSRMNPLTITIEIGSECQKSQYYIFYPFSGMKQYPK